MGRLEIFHAGQWGTICEHGFDTQKAIAACRQLGFVTGQVLFLTSRVFGVGHGPIWLDAAPDYCNGTESTLHDCILASGDDLEWGNFDCNHGLAGDSADVGVACVPAEMQTQWARTGEGN